MPDFKNMSLQQLLNPEGFVCSCGRIHKTNLKAALVGRGVIDQTADVIHRLEASKPFLICDLNTYEAAGKRVEAVLREHGMEFSKWCFPTRERLMPAERELGSICMHFDPSCDLILGIGGGVINDLCKMLGKVSGLPTAIVGTAPSMDGYASNSGAMEVDNIKTTLYTPMPCAVICDTDVLSTAPMRMIWAGIGDMVAKYISICDWRISHIINDEYFCPAVADIMRRSREATVRSMEKAVLRDGDAIAAVVEGLILAGIAMSFAGVSRPASGLEHCFSHIWEMMALERGRSYDLHGIQVGVGTVLAYRSLCCLREMGLNAVDSSFDQNAWSENVRRVFGSSAEALISSAEKSGRNDLCARQKRVDRILERRTQLMCALDEELAQLGEILKKMKTIGMPVTPSSIGISEQDALDAFVCSRDIRDRYLSTSMMWDLGVLGAIAEKMKTWMSEEGGL